MPLSARVDHIYLAEFRLVYCNKYPVGPWKMEVMDTESMPAPSIKPYLYHYASLCVRVHQHCYEFITALIPLKKRPKLVGRVVSSFMVGVNNPDARITGPWGFSPNVIYVVSKKVNIPGLARLPGEILVMIHRQSSDAPLWCLARAVDLMVEMSLMQQGTEVDWFGLSDIGSWNRGDEAPKLQKEHSKYTRITLDHRGVRKVEALNSHPEPLSEKRSDTTRFIIAERGRIKSLNADIYFKVLYRLGEKP
ncbi:hypothetical protein CDV31_001878 [Fusarium ambrosium]|uniref:Uncharacterized protein n=1 Tax=Fusarium ambrosium TaxID=131363 RepID=A0A428UY61_9HYPO|nr:hypothetical protein CDV31_001878 [Fusarium ambrosium]